MATNVDYQIIFTNGGPVTILYDTLILTNSPIVTGGPYVCTDLMITNVTIGETNIVKVGTTCVLTNNLRIVSIATNDISASLQYYILATTNLIFDAADSRCWQTVYQTNLTITTSISTNTTITDYNFTFARLRHGARFGHALAERQ